jgi:hypothetical protein
VPQWVDSYRRPLGPMPETLLPVTMQTWRVTPPEFVRVLDTHPDFPRTVDALTAPETIAAALGTLTEVGARLYLTQASRYPLIFLHAVTGPAALRQLLPHLTSQSRCSTRRSPMSGRR